jgi:F-type H+-transporting ATPase subunit b
MDKLGINPGYLISQVVNFALLLILLRMVLYRPILDMLDKRKKRIQQDLDDADSAKKEADRIQAEYQTKMDEVRKEGQETVSQAVQQGEKLKEEILAQARQEAAEIIAKGQAELEYERKQAMGEMRGQVVDLAIQAASKVVGESLDEQGHRRVIQDFLDNLGET